MIEPRCLQNLRSAESGSSTNSNTVVSPETSSSTNTEHECPRHDLGYLNNL